MKKDLSPEERLLRLIRSQKHSKASQDSSKIFLLSSFLQKLKSKFSRLHIRNVQGLLRGILFISFGYLVICLIWPKFVRQEVGGGAIKKEESKITEEEASPEIKPYNFYQKAIQDRQIFTALSIETERGDQGQSDSSITERIKELNLLGIISGDKPQAIIEDKKTQKTHFLEEGEFLGAIKVEEIGEGKVTLEFQGQRFDLFL